jgi:hypothetical protein
MVATRWVGALKTLIENTKTLASHLQMLPESLTLTFHIQMLEEQTLVHLTPLVMLRLELVLAQVLQVLLPSKC